MISTARGYTKIGTPSKLIDFVFLAVFMGYSTQFLAPGTISIARDSVHENWDVVKAHRFGHFWPFSWAIAHNFFLAPETISTACDPGYTKIGTSSKLVDLAISICLCGL